MPAPIRETLKKNFASRSTKELAEKFQRKACVAILLQGDSTESLEVAFIRRAEIPLDRWSGQIGFPGGHHEPEDETELMTAIRETREEIGIHLSEQDLLGQLDDIQARRQGEMLDFFIRPFAFWLPEKPQAHPSPAEVADFFWFKVSDLKNPKFTTHIEFNRDNINVKLPAIALKEGPPLWGLTYFMTMSLLEVVCP